MLRVSGLMDGLGVCVQRHLVVHSQIGKESEALRPESDARGKKAQHG